ncbi:esterase family protein [Parvularcula flava]|uniref:Esterase n=1 Tax=Aquisalinus luteolus TaxID=1566827 RepID=A0A8J3ERM8_9PROT|nr:alpha/beta hydrolase-fold protein [Aquisalinus luteolus]NHK28313.1 esterase family protein [Aquisalinus luteolus]GGH98099.1 esterase [Aquisalinus luteolus]
MNDNHLTTPHGGAVHHCYFDSALLADNLLGDPARRRIDVFVPEGQTGEGLPLLVDIVGYTAGGPAHTNWKNYGETVPDRAARLIAEGKMPPCVIAFPDCFTRLGGNQYINSAAMGPWDDILRTEIVPFVEQKYGCGGAGHRGIFGKSSGGYGSIVHALLHPDFWAAAACHSGDMAFELCYLPEFPKVVRALQKTDGSIRKWLEAFWAAPKVKGDDFHILMSLAMCATYDPAPDQPYGVRLPVTMDTCEVIEDRWANWLAWDPVVMAQGKAAGLKQLKALHIECGDVDQYDLVYGARRLARVLEAAGVEHSYAEFPDNHSSIDYRMDVSLPLLAKALSA